MQELLDIITFKTIISKYVLIIFYYFGAIVIPLFMYKYTHYIYTPIKSTLPRLYTLFILLFLFAEILWRMMFEFLIAFLQIRDALLT